MFTMIHCPLSWIVLGAIAAGSSTPEAGYLKPGTAEVGGVRHLCLIYHGQKSRPEWTGEALVPYVAYVDPQGKPVDWLFDSFLLIEFANDAGVSLYHDTNKKPWPTVGDWQWLADAWFRENTGLVGLDRAMATAGKTLGDAKRKANVVISVPLPQRSIRRFGPLPGQNTVLDFSNEADRQRALQWYVDAVLDRYAKADYSRLRLAGFYWTSETISAGDRALVRWLAKYVHKKGAKFYWIPYFNAAGVERWKDWGFDAMMLQPNHFFHENSSPSRLADTARRAQAAGAGVEMEFDSRAIRSGVFQRHFYDYLDAGAKYGWMTGSVLGWYEGGGALRLFVDQPDKGRTMYDALYRFVKGNYVPAQRDRP